MVDVNDITARTSAGIQHNCSSPVFIVGCPRSGTSLSSRLLRDYLSVAFGTESQFFLRYYRRLTHYGDLTDDRRMHLLLRDLSHERWFARTHKNFGFTFDPARAFAELEARTYAGALRAIFLQFASHMHMPRWGDKTPEYGKHLPILLELFPDAQFIHVVRDGRDVALSLFRVGFGPKTVYEAALDWRQRIAPIHAFGQSLPANRFMEFRYEDLLAAPVDVMKTVARFLQIDDADGRYMESIAEPLRLDVRPDNSRKWRDQLSRRELECFETITRDELRRYGYDLSCASTKTRVSRVEVVRSQLAGCWRRLSNAKYWADTLYKIRLRARDVMLPLRVGVSTRPVDSER